MTQIGSISDRIKQLVSFFAGGNNSKFAAILDTSETNIRNYINGTVPKFDFVQKLCSNFAINADWLLTGKGEMLKDSNVIIGDNNSQANVKATNTGHIVTVSGKSNYEKIISEKGVELVREPSQDYETRRITDLLNENEKLNATIAAKDDLIKSLRETIAAKDELISFLKK